MLLQRVSYRLWVNDRKRTERLEHTGGVYTHTIMI